MADARLQEPAAREQLRAYLNALNGPGGSACAPTMLYVLTVDAEERRDHGREYGEMVAGWREHHVHVDRCYNGLACRDRVAHPDTFVCMRMNHVRGEGCNKPACKAFWRARHVCMACGDAAHGMWMRGRDELLLCPVTRRFGDERKRFMHEFGRHGWTELLDNVNVAIGAERGSDRSLLRSAPDGSPRVEIRKVAPTQPEFVEPLVVLSDSEPEIE